MSARVKATVWLCVAPTLAHVAATFMALRFGRDLLNASIYSVPAILLLCAVSLLLVILIFAGGFRHLVSGWLVWPAMVLNGGLMILIFSGIYAAGGLICIAEICDNDRYLPHSSPYLHAPLGAAVSIDAETECQPQRPAIGAERGDPSGCIALDTSMKTALYFSAVTFSTVGYGDFQPIPRLRLVAALEAVFGFLFFGLLTGAAIDTFSRVRPRRKPEEPDDARKVAQDMNQALVALRAKLGDSGR